MHIANDSKPHKSTIVKVHNWDDYDYGDWADTLKGRLFKPSCGYDYYCVVMTKKDKYGGECEIYELNTHQGTPPDTGEWVRFNVNAPHVEKVYSISAHAKYFLISQSDNFIQHHYGNHILKAMYELQQYALNLVLNSAKCVPYEFKSGEEFH